MQALFRFKIVIALMALSLIVLGGMTAPVSAQDAMSTAESPIMGVWVSTPTGNEGGSITALSADGMVVDHETDGTSALGTWEATGPTSGIATFVFFMNEPTDEFTGTVIVRATLEYDQTTDIITATYDTTGVLTDGTPVFGGGELDTLTLIRMPVQGPDMGGKPIQELVGAPVASPEATPAG